MRTFPVADWRTRALRPLKCVVTSVTFSCHRVTRVSRHGCLSESSRPGPLASGVSGILLAVWLVGLASPCQAQTITWLHPTAAGGDWLAGIDENAAPGPRN